MDWIVDGLLIWIVISIFSGDFVGIGVALVSAATTPPTEMNSIPILFYFRFLLGFGSAFFARCGMLSHSLSYSNGNIVGPTLPETASPERAKRSILLVRSSLVVVAGLTPSFFSRAARYAACVLLAMHKLLRRSTGAGGIPGSFSLPFFSLPISPFCSGARFTRCFFRGES